MVDAFLQNAFVLDHDVELPPHPGLLVFRQSAVKLRPEELAQLRSTARQFLQFIYDSLLMWLHVRPFLNFVRIFIPLAAKPPHLIPEVDEVFRAVIVQRPQPVRIALQVP